MNNFIICNYKAIYVEIYILGTLHYSLFHVDSIEIKIMPMSNSLEGNAPSEIQFNKETIGT
jgi:hypothetical protein